MDNIFTIGDKTVFTNGRDQIINLGEGLQLLLERIDSNAMLYIQDKFTGKRLMLTAMPVPASWDIRKVIEGIPFKWNINDAKCQLQEQGVA